MPAGRSETHLGDRVDAIPEQIVVHVDCDCFYAACERRRDPRLRDAPVVVGMGYEESTPGGAVATASYDARDHGVEAAMPIEAARRQLPRMVDADTDDPDAPDPSACGYYRPVDMSYYESVGQSLRTLLAERADILEPISIDEAFLDVTDRLGWDDTERFVEELQETIAAELDLPVSIGVAPTKSAAKIAADTGKPKGTTVVPPAAVVEFLGPLSVAVLPGVGPVTHDSLREDGIETIGDLATAEPGALIDEFGRRGQVLHRRARGIDPRQVTPPADPKSLSKEQSFREPLTEMEAKQHALESLVEAVSDRADDQGVLYRTVGIKVIAPPYDVTTRAETLPGPINDRVVAKETAGRLLAEFTDRPIRKLGVRLGKLSITDTEQPTLGAWDDKDSSRPPAINNDSRQTTLQEFHSCRSS